MFGDPARRSLALEEAIVRYRRAARWYAPGNGYVSRSLEALRRIARLAEKHGDRQTALMAYRAIRRAILGSRSFFTPHADHLGPANRNIARLSALDQGGKTAGADQLARHEAWHLAQLRHSTAPAVGWSILAVLGFFTWVAGAFLFIYRAITPEDRFVNRQAVGRRDPGGPDPLAHGPFPGLSVPENRVPRLDRGWMAPRTRSAPERLPGNEEAGWAIRLSPHGPCGT